MVKKYIFLIFIFISNIALSQELDTAKLNKMYFKALHLEETFPDSALCIYEQLIEKTKTNPILGKQLEKKVVFNMSMN